MRSSFVRLVWVAPFLWIAGGCGTSGANCSDGALASALAGATSGQTVELGACTAHGTFTVPAGVTLHGQGPASSRIDAPGLGVVLGAGATLDGVRIDHGGAHGVVAVGVASVTVRNVEVHCSLGRSALGFADVASVTLTNVVATGPVADETAAQMLPSHPTAADTCRFGLVLQRVGTATLTDVSATGFGSGGVVSTETALTWTRGHLDGNLTLGAWIDGGTATMTDLSIDGTLRGFGIAPPFGLAIGRGANVHTDGLHVTDTHQGFGILQDTGDAVHMGLLCSGHAGGGIVVQHSHSMQVGGGMIVDNSFGGLVAVEASGVSVDSTMVAHTSLSARLLTSWGTAMVGDGIQIVRPADVTTLTDVALVGSGRVGLLADLGGMDAALVDATRVTTSETMEYGCVLQNGTGITPATSGALCMRDTTALTADLTPSMLEVVGIVMPTEIPATGDLLGIVMPTE